MIKHIVLFQLREIAKDKKNELFLSFKTAIEQLPEKINLIKSISVKKNINPLESYDFCLDGLFNNMEDVSQYAQHPCHIAAVNIIKEYIQSRACVDIEE